MHQNIKNLKCIHALYCGTAEWQKIFMRKFQTRNYIYRKTFPIYSRVISNKHYHGNMPNPTKLVGSNFNCFNCVFIAATTESFADANKMNTKSLHGNTA